MKAQEIKVNMLNWENGQIETCIIDISRFYVPNYDAPLDFEHQIVETNKEKQEAILKEWVKKHVCDTMKFLTFDSFEII